MFDILCILLWGGHIVDGLYLFLKIIDSSRVFLGSFFDYFNFTSSAFSSSFLTRSKWLLMDCLSWIVFVSLNLTSKWNTHQDFHRPQHLDGFSLHFPDGRLQRVVGMHKMQPVHQKFGQVSPLGCQGAGSVLVPTAAAVFHNRFSETSWTHVRGRDKKVERTAIPVVSLYS